MADQNQLDPAISLGIPPDELPEVIANRIKVQEGRLPPLREERQENEELNQGLAQLDQWQAEEVAKIESQLQQMRQDMEQERQRLREAAEEENRQLRQATSEAEKRLTDALEKAQAAEVRLAEVERQEVLFAERHKKHDVELQGLIEENRQHTRGQLEIVRRMLARTLPKA
ncbi:MAG: hypothetical protein Q7S10_03140 [bacterium]|nr:hypothetical protein [bacterium]